MNQYQNDRNNTQEQFMGNLIRYTYSADPNLRLASYTALGRVPSREALDCLLRGLEDELPSVRETAKKSLEQLVQFCSIYGYQKIGG